MSRRVEETVGLLQAAAERAAGSMRAVSIELDEIAERLPERGNGARKHQLLLTSRRLSTAADALLVEAQACSPHTVKLASRIARKVLLASGTFALAATSGVATGVGQAAYEKYSRAEGEAHDALNEVDAQQEPAQAAMAAAVQSELDALRHDAMKLADGKRMSVHPAFAGLTESLSNVAVQGEGPDQVANLIVTALIRMNHFSGEPEDYEEDDPALPELREIWVTTEQLGDRINRLRPLIDALEESGS